MSHAADTRRSGRHSKQATCLAVLKEAEPEEEREHFVPVHLSSLRRRERRHPTPSSLCRPARAVRAPPTHLEALHVAHNQRPHLRVQILEEQPEAGGRQLQRPGRRAPPARQPPPQEPSGRRRCDMAGACGWGQREGRDGGMQAGHQARGAARGAHMSPIVSRMLSTASGTGSASCVRSELAHAWGHAFARAFRHLLRDADHEVKDLRRAA